MVLSSARAENLYKWRDRAGVARKTHNLEAGGSSPSPATHNQLINQLKAEYPELLKLA